MKQLIDFFGLFLYEYVGNHFVNSLPSAFLRYLFYRYVLRIDCNKSVYFQMHIYIYSSRSVLKIGDNTIINRGCVLDRRGTLQIGCNVNISPNVSIYTAGHKINDDYFNGYKEGVVIEDYVWLGTGAMVMPGVNIGKGACVMPGAVVVNDVLPMEIVGGVPAENIGKRKSALKYSLNWRPYFM